MNKAFEKILELIKQNTIQNKDSISFFNECGVKFISAGKAKEIVQEVAEEYNGGWIACSERLPDKAGYEVIATLENVYGQRRVTIIFTGYGDSQWHCNHKEFDLDVWKVIAWQPLPEPFKERD